MLLYFHALFPSYTGVLGDTSELQLLQFLILNVQNFPGSKCTVVYKCQWCIANEFLMFVNQTRYDESSTISHGR